MLLFPNALCCSLYERNCVCAVTKIFTKFLPANNFCQLLRVTRKRSCTTAGNAQAQLHFRDDQQRAFGISNISNSDHTWIHYSLSQELTVWLLETLHFQVMLLKFGINCRPTSKTVSLKHLRCSWKATSFRKRISNLLCLLAPLNISSMILALYKWHLLIDWLIHP